MRFSLSVEERSRPLLLLFSSPDPAADISDHSRFLPERFRSHVALLFAAAAAARFVRATRFQSAGGFQRADVRALDDRTRREESGLKVKEK